MRAEIDRAAIEGWIDSSARVFCVYVATRGERIALSGKVVRADDRGIVLVTAHDREGRGSFAMYEQIETLHVGGAKVATETREVATEPPKPAGRADIHCKYCRRELVGDDLCTRLPSGAFACEECKGSGFAVLSEEAASR